MKLREFIQSNTVLLDGGTGTLLQRAGLPLGELPERWNCTHAQTVREIHRAYYDAGSHIVCTNTFGANALKFGDEELEEIIKAAIENVKAAQESSCGKQPKFVALDIGPCGKLLKPYGDLAFEDAVALFAKTVRLGVKYGADCILIETMGDSYETKAAVLAAKENSSLPVFVSCAYGEDGKLLTGASPEAMVALLEGLRVDAIGVNCSFGPKGLLPIVERLLDSASLPVLVKPNADLPNADGEYEVDEKDFAAYIAQFVRMGVRMVGGCCGTTPAYIRAAAEAVRGLPVLPISKKEHARVSSYAHAIEFDKPLLIGERINPTGKKRFKQALLEKDVAYVLNEGITQQEKGAHILDVNVGLPELDEELELPRYIEELQAVIHLPLQIDTSNTAAMERAMRVYNGKPLVNSVNGKKESMDGIFPLVQKYGGVVVGLTLDERGIPDSAAGRLEIAQRILREAEKYGIDKKDILIDPLAMTVSADKTAAEVTLETVKLLSAAGIKTSLGVSNVSFGLPCREILNATFFARALENGLSAAIVNPNSVELLKTYYAYLALSGQDENFENYIRFATQELPQTATPTAVATANAPSAVTAEITGNSPLKTAIIKGLKADAAKACESLLQSLSATEIIGGEIVPALDAVGQAFEQKRAFLPQLLMSAEAAKAAFELIKRRLLLSGEKRENKGKIVLATVKGDIHDIGKNIVATLMENYGFEVRDLGKDVSPQRVLEEVEQTGATLVGLSALMTTTVPSMQETISLLKEKTPWVKVIVGGAVLNEDYAVKIGADGYAKDALGAVYLAEKFMQK